MARKSLNIAMTDETVDVLGNLFIDNNVLNKHGISFIAFIEEWKSGKIEQYI